MLRSALRSGTLNQWFAQAAVGLQLLILLPLVFKNLSIEHANIWMLLSLVSSFQFVADAGVTPTLTRAYAQLMGEGLRPTEINITAMRSVWIEAQNLYQKLIISSFLLFGSIGTLLMLKPILALNAEEQFSVWVSWFVVLFFLHINIASRRYISLLQASGQLAKQQRIHAVCSLIGFALASVLLVLTRDILCGVLALHLPELLKLAWYKFMLERGTFGVVVGTGRKEKLDENSFSKIWTQIYKSAGGVLLGYSVVQLSGFYAAQVMEPAESASYLLILRLTFALRRFANAPFYSQIPKFNRLYVKKDLGALRSLAIKRMSVSMNLFLVGSLIMVFILPPALAMFSAEAAVNSKLWVCLSIAGALERYGAMSLQLYTLTNDVRWHVANGVGGVIMLALFHPLYLSMGAIGLVVSMLLAYGVFYMPYSVSLTRKLFKSVSQFHSAVIARSSIAFIFLGCSGL